jgi:DNA-directed RNA polymerase specialized sigma24 family protein
VTVQGETPTVPAADHQAADQLFTEIYAQHWDSIRRHIYFRLDQRHGHMAEDLAQTVFMRFWREYVLTGRLRDPDNARSVRALLKVMTQGPIRDFYELRSTQRDRSLDFTDPVNTPLINNGHTYALDSPELRAMVYSLEAAMDHMTACSEKWRALHKERYTLRSHLADDYLAARGGLTDDAKARIASRIEAADAEEGPALDAFRQACARVGKLRANIEAEAGVNWKSATGLPVAPETTAFRKGSYRNDRSVTHCPEGHLLEKDNVRFDKDGSRACRACKAAISAKTTAARVKNPTGRGARPTVSDDVINRARAILSDPNQAGRSLPSIAEQLGVSGATLLRRVPDYKDLRAAALETAGTAR